jgi:hypothetical protein
MISSDDFAGTVTTFASEYTALPVPVDVFCAPNLNSSTVTLPAFVPSTFDTMIVLSLNTCPEFTGFTTTLDDTVVMLATFDLPRIVVTATMLGAAIYFSLYYTVPITISPEPVNRYTQSALTWVSVGLPTVFDALTALRRMTTPLPPFKFDGLVAVGVSNPPAPPPPFAGADEFTAPPGAAVAPLGPVPLPPAPPPE